MSEAKSHDSYDAHRLLRGLELFRHLDAATLDELAQELEWFALPGGATLFEYGDPSDALCVLKSGVHATLSGVVTYVVSSPAMSEGEPVGMVGTLSR